MTPTIATTALMHVASTLLGQSGIFGSTSSKVDTSALDAAQASADAAAAARQEALAAEEAEAAEEAKEAKEREARRLAKLEGAKSTVTTSGQGVLGDADLAKAGLSATTLKKTLGQ
ncbi:MAG: hypothetical protein AB7E47_09850 [Desulfovibrionaceae bacterium]